MTTDNSNSPPDPSNFKSALAVPELRRIQIARGLGKIMFWGWVVTRNTVAFNEGGAWAVGLILAVHMIPGALLTPLYAVVADRLGPVRGLAVLARVRAVAMVIAAIILFVDGPFIALLIVSVFEGMGTHPSDAIHLRVLPWLARTPGELTAANSLTEILRMNGLLVGPACAVLMLLIAEPSVAIAVFAIGGIVTALLYIGIENSVPILSHGGVSTVLSNLNQGFRTIVNDVDIVILVAFQAWLTVCVASIQVFAAALSLDVLDLGNSGPPLLSTAFGVGGLLGGLVSFRLSGRRNLVLPWAIGGLMIGVSILSMGVYASLPTVLAAMTLGGVGLVLFMVSGVTLMQRGIPSQVQSSVFGFNFLVTNAGFGIGGVLSSSLVINLGLSPAMMLIGFSMVLVTPLAALSLKRFANRVNTHGNEVELLRESDIFKSLSVAPLERIAGALERVTFLPNEKIIQQGEKGDHFFIIAAGSFVVTIDNAFVCELERGESFGEIALINDVPRTATVVAKTHSEAYRLNRDNFINALTVNPQSKRAASQLSKTRLHQNAQ